MTYDILIKNGTIVDGSGLARYRADLAVQHGRIVEIGRIRDGAREVVDADGLVVAPGFIDGHTHMDAQVSWDPLGTCSSLMGVTSVVMGNCGFTLAPCRADQRELFMHSLEAVEDIPVEAMRAGIDWQWETFPEYLDALARMPKGINYGGYVGHTALRLYAMGERAFSEAPTDADLALMRREIRDALRAGAQGFSTSRFAHTTPDGRPVPSRVATWDEVHALTSVLGELNTGVFQIAGPVGTAAADREETFGHLREIALETRRPVTQGLFNWRRSPDSWRPYMALVDETAAAGGRMFAQVHSQMLMRIHSFEGELGFDHFPVWEELRARPLAEQQTALRDAAYRARLVDAAHAHADSLTEAVRPDYNWFFVLEEITGSNPTLAEVARDREQDPVEALIDIALETDLKQIFVQVLANEDQDALLEVMRHPRSVVTFSDSGAHVGHIAQSCLQTHVLSHWARDQEALTLEEAVRLITFDVASAWSIRERGLLREGWAADIVVFDPATVAYRNPEIVRDLPAGAMRVAQRGLGFAATIVNGEVLFRDGEHTGAYPGQVLRAGGAARG